MQEIFKEYKDKYSNIQQDIINGGLESGKNTASRTFAKRYNRNLKKNGELTGAELYNLVNANDEAFLNETENDVDTENNDNEKSQQDKILEVYNRYKATGKIIKMDMQSEIDSKTTDSTIDTEKTATKTDYKKLDLKTRGEIQSLLSKNTAKNVQKQDILESIASSDLSDMDIEYTTNAAILGYDGSTAVKIISFAKENGIAPNKMIDLDMEYRMGYINVPIGAKTKSSSLFTEEQIKGIREIGLNARPQKNSNLKIASKLGSNKIIDDTLTGIDNSAFSDRQKKSVEVVKKLSSVVGNYTHIFESEEKDGGFYLTKDLVNSKGDVIKHKGDKAPNGFYDPKSGEIFIDINSGKSGEGVIMYTVAHEYVHFIRAISSKAFYKLADIVVKELTDNGTNVEDLINAQVQKAKRNGRKISFDEAYEEFIADSLETQLTSKDTAYYLNNIYKSDKKLFKHLVNKLREFYMAFSKMVKEYKGLDSTHRTRESYEMEKLSKEAIKRISKVYAEALKVSSGAYQGVNLEKSNAKTENNSLNTAENTEKSTEENGAKYSIREIIGDSGKNYGIGVYLDSNLLNGLNDSERKQMVKLRVVEELAGNHFIAYDRQNNPIDIMIAGKSEKIHTKSGKKKQVIKELYNKNIDKNIKQEAVILSDELIKVADFDKSVPANHKHEWLDNNGNNLWDEWTVYIQSKEKSVWKATLNIANDTNGRKILYDIDPIKKVEGASKSAPTSTNNTVSQNTPVVNSNSMQNGGNNSTDDTKLSDRMEVKKITPDMSDDERAEI